VLSFFPANKFDVQEVLQLHRFGTWTENRLFYRNQIASLQLACIALVSKQISWCIGRNVGVLPIYLLSCVVPTAHCQVPNPISVGLTIKTISAVMRRIENRTRGVTLPTSHPRPPRVTRHTHTRAVLKCVCVR
jgi:hypothetical protein